MESSGLNQRERPASAGIETTSNEGISVIENGLGQEKVQPVTPATPEMVAPPQSVVPKAELNTPVGQSKPELSEAQRLAKAKRLESADLSPDVLAQEIADLQEET